MTTGDQTSDVLQRADIRIEPSSKCPYLGGLDNTQICAGGYIKHNALSLADACQVKLRQKPYLTNIKNYYTNIQVKLFDSGGPLFCLNKL